MFEEEETNEPFFFLSLKTNTFETVTACPVSQTPPPHPSLYVRTLRIKSIKAKTRDASPHRAPALTCFPFCSRRHHECDLGPLLCVLHHHFLSGGYRLHSHGGPLLRGLHRRHPAHPHLRQSGMEHTHPPPPPPPPIPDSAHDSLSIPIYIIIIKIIRLNLFLRIL